jgi:hypothetical protein
MTGPVVAAAFLCGMAVFLATPALSAAEGHHGNASFDTDKRLTLKGTVTDWLWANPHCFLKIDVKDDSGEVRNWNLELGNPTDMSLVGFRRNLFKAGDVVTAFVQPVKSGAPIGRLINVVLADGQKLPQPQQ